MTNNTTIAEIEQELNRYHKLYDALRIIDPVNRRIMGRADNSVNGSGDIPCAYWKSDLIGEDSIAMCAFQGNECFTKLEHTDDFTFLVIAIPIKISNDNLVLELFKNVTNSFSIGSNDYSDPINSLSR